MPRYKNETLSIRTTPEIKSLLRQLAEGERRSVASMVEVLVLERAATHGLVVPPPTQSTPSKRVPRT